MLAQRSRDDFGFHARWPANCSNRFDQIGLATISTRALPDFGGMSSPKISQSSGAEDSRSAPLTTATPSTMLQDRRRKVALFSEVRMCDRAARRFGSGCA